MQDRMQDMIDAVVSARRADPKADPFEVAEGVFEENAETFSALEFMALQYVGHDAVRVFGEVEGVELSAELRDRLRTGSPYMMGSGLPGEDIARLAFYGFLYFVARDLLDED